MDAYVAGDIINGHTGKRLTQYNAFVNRMHMYSKYGWPPDSLAGESYNSNNKYVDTFTDTIWLFGVELCAGYLLTQCLGFSYVMGVGLLSVWD